MKRIFSITLLFLGAFLLSATVAQAGDVLYAVKDGDNMILKCGDSAPESSCVYNGTTGWMTNRYFTSATIDASCQSYSGNTLAYLFVDCNELQTVTGLSNLNTASTTSMEGMFLSCSSLTSIDLSSFSTANVTNMCGMFWACSALTSLDLSSFNTAKVTNMQMMLGECKKLSSLNLSGWNTASVTNMNAMFYECEALTSLDLSGWNTSSVTNMSVMLSGCSGLTSLDVSKFNTDNVTDMHLMFNGCSSLTRLDVSNFNTENVTVMWNMFSYCTNLTTIYCNDAWNCEFSDNMFYRCTSLVGAISYDESKTYATYANPSTGYFTVKGGSEVFEPDESVPYAVLSDNNTTLTFYYDGNKASRNGMDVGPFQMNYSAWPFTVNSGWYDQRESITSVVLDKTFANYKDLTSMAYWFYECSNLKTINGFENLNTANVTCMGSMFYGCSNLTSLDISKFNTANVTDMDGMFYDCSNLTSLDVSNFNTANVKGMNSMFCGCSNLTSLDVSKFNTANVTGMWSMFEGCSNLTSLDVSKFNTANVTYMVCMFEGCSNLTSLDVSKFNTANVTEMDGMFYDCSNLKTLYCNQKWSCDDSQDMFKGCTSLKGVVSYDSGKVDATYANPTTGYFTAVDQGDANGDGDITD